MIPGTISSIPYYILVRGSSSSGKKSAQNMQKRGVWLLAILLCIPRVVPLTISAPSSARDYREIAILLNTFDAPTSDTSSPIDTIKWNMFERSLTEQYTFNQYIRNARKMRDKKYCVIVAKEYIIDENDDMKLRVVGMAEMGMSICPISTCSNDKDTKLSPQPTLGVLCVSPDNQKNGVGKALVEKCEQIAADIWKDGVVVVDVEPSNHNALSFFERCGYDYISEDDSGEKHTRNTTVVRRRKAESKPHYLLRKNLATSLQESDA